VIDVELLLPIRRIAVGNVTTHREATRHIYQGGNRTSGTGDSGGSLSDLIGISEVAGMRSRKESGITKGRCARFGILGATVDDRYRKALFGKAASHELADLADAPYSGQDHSLRRIRHRSTRW
jgi:hypothetical protein